MSSNKKGFPSDLQDLWDELSKDVTLLHARWIIFKQLYATDEERVALFNKIAGTFFGLLKGILIDDIILGLSRLTDPPKSMRHENLVLEQLIKKLDSATHSSLAASLQKQLDELKKVCEPIRKNRNRRIAHADLKTALAVDSSVVLGIPLETFEEAFKRVRGYMNHFEEYVNGGSPTAFDHVWMRDDANSLVSALEAAMNYWTALREDLIPLEFQRKGHQRDV